MTTDLSNLQMTIEGIRAERFPALPAGLVRSILQVEADHQEDSQRRSGQSKVRALVDNALEG
jgi:hypothetical protein